VVRALVQGAKDEWENEEFEDTYGDATWDALPTCQRHDFRWSEVLDVLLME
jgi:hypothetical protein